MKRKTFFSYGMIPIPGEYSRNHNTRCYTEK